MTWGELLIVAETHGWYVREGRRVEGFNHYENTPPGFPCFVWMWQGRERDQIRARLVSMGHGDGEFIDEDPRKILEMGPKAASRYCEALCISALVAERLTA